MFGLMLVFGKLRIFRIWLVAAFLVFAMHPKPSHASYPTRAKNCIGGAAYMGRSDQQWQTESPQYKPVTLPWSLPVRLRILWRGERICSALNLPPASVSHLVVD